MSPLSRENWSRCSGCGTPMPEGQTCFECATQAALKWKLDKLEFARNSARKKKK